MAPRLLEDLPQRFRADCPPDLDARFRLHVGQASRDVVVSRSTCRLESPNGVVPDTEITTDPGTWALIDAGRLSGIEAFADQRLWVKGSIEASLQFEPLFERPDAGGLRYSIRTVPLGPASMSVLEAGSPDATPLLLIHGLGATKASWLTVVPALARRYRVIALDLVGFGASSKPLAQYTAPFFAGHVTRLMDQMGIDKALVAGNSMGGRVAMELGMTAPERVTAIACLCPAAAFRHRPLLWLARLARSELGVLAYRLPRGRLEEGLRALFAQPERIHESWYEAAIDDFLVTWRSPRARLAFFSALRNIYLDEPDGEAGFWTRLAAMKVPALYIYGRHDYLITPRFGTRVQKTLPGAQVAVWDDCGHVPQLEHPERAATTMLDFFAGAGARRRAG